MSDGELQNRINTLLEPMLKIRMYAVINHPLKPAAEIMPFVPDHLEYMIQLEKSGILFASGPFVEPGVLVGSGLTILRATNLEQAKSYMDEEPLVKRGLRDYQIWEWELREGRFNLSLEFATGRYQVT